MLFAIVFRLAPALTLLICGLPAAGAVFVPLSIEELARSSFAVVVGGVIGIEVRETERGTLQTEIALGQVRVLRGVDVGTALVLREEGGVLGAVSERVSGAPQFEIGEEVLLFLAREDSGAFRVHHGMLGKMRLVHHPARGLEARRDRGNGATYVALPGKRTHADAVSWDVLLAALGAAGATPLAGSAPTARFRITQAGRFFEPDEGITVDFRLDFRGDSAFGFATSKASVDAALAAWTAVAGATVVLRDIGVTGDLGRACPGPNKVIFDDPEGIIAPPIIDPVGADPRDCRGELARGIQRTSRFEKKSFNGLDMERVTCGFLIFADGWDDCEVWTPCNLAEIAAHEIGHLLGLGHSSENAEEADAALREATMYFRAHFDGRCASLRDDDAAGARFLYPEALPPTITTPPVLPNGAPRTPYSIQLTAIGGTGNLAWTLVGGGFPGMTLSPGGLLSGIPEANGSSFFQVRAADAAGNSHVKVLNFTAGTPGPLPRTATPTATVSPTASAIATVTATTAATPAATPTLPQMCAGDCDGSGTVTVDEILILVNIALGNAVASGCTAGDRDRNGSVTVDEILLAVSLALVGCGE